MAQFPTITLTNLGLNLIAEAQAGSNLIFTKIQMGDGQLSTSDNIATMTALKSAKLDIPINKFENMGNGQLRLRYLVDNSNVDTGFFGREVGVFAKIGESGAEQLYAYVNTGNLTDYVPDKNTPVNIQIFDVYVIVGNATSLSVIIDKTIAYVVQEDLDELIVLAKTEPSSYKVWIEQVE